MPYVSFNSIPSNALFTKLNSIPVSPTPTSPPSDLANFRKMCMLNGSVKVSWNQIKLYLINHTVSKIWWDLTEKERRSIGEIAIKNTLFYTISQYSLGGLNCSGMDLNPLKAQCVTNARVRQYKFGKPLASSDSCYFKDQSSTFQCFDFNEYYDLPIHSVGAYTLAGVDKPFGHAMAGLQVNQDVSRYQSWIIFQYSDCDIQLSTWQIPSHRFDLKLNISKTYRLDHCQTAWANRVGTWNLY